MTFTERIIVQPDWEDMFSKKIDEFWVQYKYSSAPAINGKIKADLFDSSKLIGMDGFSARIINTKSIEITFKETSRKFISSRTHFSIHQNQVLSIDVSNGGLGISSSSDGTLNVWDAETGRIRRSLNGHVSDVNVCKFFPSGLAAVSGSLDMRLKIWSLEDGSCPVTLIGHTAGISDVSIVDRGRNIVSAGRDGACKLWDLSKSKCISTLSKLNCIINACDIQSNTELASSQDQIDAGEVGTDGKLVSCACEDGFLRILDVRGRNTVFDLNCENAANCCSFLNEYELVTGTQDGYLIIWDLRHTAQSKTSWKEFRSSILSVRRFSNQENAFIASTSDGSCFTWNLNSPHPINDFTGSNLESVYAFAFNDKYLYTGCKDALIRKYELSQIL